MSRVVICKIIRDLVFSEAPMSGDTDSIVVKQAIFKTDFGPWKDGQRAEVLIFDFEHGHIEERLEGGDLVTRECLKLEIDK